MAGSDASRRNHAGLGFTFAQHRISDDAGNVYGARDGFGIGHFKFPAGDHGYHDGDASPKYSSVAFGP